MPTNAARSKPIITMQKVRLLGEPYLPPACRVDSVLYDVARDEYYKVGGWTDGRISWPRRKKNGTPSLICTEELARALRTESAMAITYWWGMSQGTICTLRGLLDEVGKSTPGTKKLKAANVPIHFTPNEAAKGRAKAATPESIAKMSATQKARERTPMSPETKQLIAQKRREWWAKQSQEKRAENNKRMQIAKG